MKDLTWVEISRDAFRFNISQFRRLAGRDRKIMAVIKSNAYGHGLYEMASLIQETENSADMAGVFSLEEALLLRSKGITLPVFIMGYVPAENFCEIADNGFSVCISSLEQINAVSSVIGDRKLKIHLKFDSGLRRLGFYPKQLPDLYDFLEQHRNFIPEGIFSHFANIEDTVDHSFAMQQRATFEKMCVPFVEKYRPLRHIACSAAGLLFDQTYFEMIRTGISMYGMWPSKETLITSLKTNSKVTELRPLLTWKTRIAQIKEVLPGDTVGYGRSYKVTRQGRIAVIPVGYSDGYDRRFSNNAKVVVRGTEAPVIGRICMNMCMIDVSHVENVEIEDEVILIGCQGSGSVSADFLADISGTINYEITTRISQSIKRIIV